MLRPARLRPRAIALPFLGLVAAAVLLGAIGGAHAAATGNADLRGAWSVGGPYAQTTTITQENLATGVFSGRGVAHNNTGYTWPSHGVVHGNTIVTWIFGPYDQVKQYTATCKGTVSADGKQVTGECKDTYGRPYAPGWTLSRPTGPAGGTGSSSTEPAVCVGGCDSTQVSYDPTVDPGQTTEVVDVGCGGARTTSSATTFAGEGSCAVDGTLVQAQVDAAQKTEAALQNMIDEVDKLSAQTSATNDAAMQNLIDSLQQSQQLQDAQSQLDQLNNLQQQINNTLKNAIDNMQASNLEAADTALAADFPPEPASAYRATSSARAAAATVLPLLVFQSITATHPSAAAARAFKAELKVATGATYSPARAQARLTLTAALILGRHALAIGLKGRQIVIAHLKATVKARSKRKLTLVATPAGARVLRLLEIAGLGHKVTLPLRLSSTYKGKTTHATRQLTVK